MTTALTSQEERYIQSQDRANVEWAAHYKDCVARCRPDNDVCLTCLDHHAKNPKAQTKYGTILPSDCNLSTYQGLCADIESPVWAGLTDVERANYKIAKDPIYWAAARLHSLRDIDKPWSPEWYQIEPLRCTAPRLLLLYGRQVGKCLSHATLGLYDGSRVPIEELVGKTFDVVSLDGTKIIPRRATVTKNIVKPCVRVRFTSGRELGASTDHPFRTFDSWVDAADLQPGERVASVGRGVFGSTDIPDEEAEMLGLAIGDGGLTGDSFKFTNVNTAIRQRMAEIAEYYGCHLSWEDDITCTVALAKGRRNPAIKVLRNHEVFGKLSKHKSVPYAIQTGTPRVVSLFLNRLFGCDGWACVCEDGTTQIGYCSASKDLARGVQELLFKFGIFSTLYERHPKIDGKTFDAWQILINRGDDIRKFAETIGILGKEEAVQNVVDNIRPPTNNERSIADTLPKEARALATAALRGRSECKACPDIRIKRNRGLSRRVARSLDDRLDAPELRAWADSEDILWDEVVSVEDIGEHQTYSVSIRDTDVYDEQNFSAEGIFTHNTEVLAVKILFRLDTRRDYKIVVVCPFQSQVSMIYTRLVALIEASPELSVRVRRKRENPHHEIQLDNGSFVRLFTAGVQTGKSATDVRGQSADWLVYDEADYLDDDTITTTLAVLTRAPNPELFVSSTPTGKRGLFYEWATDPSHGFRVLHCTSMEAPEWNERDELFLRKTYSAAFFAHEFEARFGSLEAGVFNRQYLEAEGTIQDYDINNPVPQKNELYVIGVDWNSKGIGGVLCVVGFNTKPRSLANPNGHKFRMAYREVVDPEQWTQTVAVAAVTRLNRVWDPRYIYVDRGHGEMQVEILQQHGLANRSTGLHKRVKGVAMQENTEITNPLTKRKEKKQAKNLMVELCVARLEQADLVLPKSEDHLHGLIGQMREYEIEYVGRGGKKVYSGKNEHLLTAWMLAIFGFIMEMSDIRKSATTSEVILLDSNLEKALTGALARMKGQATAKPSPQPQQRTAPKKTLDVLQAVRMNNRGYVPRRALRAVQPLGRRKW